MKTAKSLGFKKGDLVFTGSFAGVLTYDAHMATPMCEVFGVVLESGSVYAHDLRKINAQEFKTHAAEWGHKEPFRVYSPVAKKALKDAGLKVQS